MSKKVTKQTGRVYTPKYLVKNILDLCGYVEGACILDKHIIDNSCGDGAILTEVVSRFIRTALAKNISKSQIQDILATYIHGIELDKQEVEKCKANLTAIATDFGITDVVWDIVCGDALNNTTYLGKMDFVVGNPPYVRVHNLDIDTEFLKNNYSFVRGGMTDLYLAFYELGLYMLNDTGVLSYVTPSSFFNSKAGRYMRDYITHARSVKAVVDLGHFQPFGATTYVTIMLLTKHENLSVDYYTYERTRQEPKFVSRLSYEDFLLNDGTFVFHNNDLVNKVSNSEGVRKLCVVKNAFTTLLDEFFISDEFPFTDYVIPVLKASTGVQELCLFPYDTSGKVIPYKVMCCNAEIQKRYQKYRTKLLNRDLSMRASWHEFGRIQGIKDVYKNKYAINNLIRDESDVKLVNCPSGTGVYSGLYILTEVAEEKLREVLISKDFVTYIHSLGKYKSGGYYTFSSKELQLYLNYMLSQATLLD